MRNVLSPLRYPGGKTCLVPFLTSALELNGLMGCEFVEPYAGSGAAALHLLMGEYVDAIRINDRDARLCALWKCMLSEPAALCDRILSEPITIENWHSQREVYLHHRRHSVRSVAFATLFLNRCNRSGIITSGGPIGGYHQSGEWKLDVRFDRQELCRRIEGIAAFSDRIHLSNLDGLGLLQSVQRRKRRVLVFLDPPYVEKGDRLYQTDFNLAKHRRLCRHLLETAAYPWVLTYDDSAFVRRLYRSRRPWRINLHYAAQNKCVGTELLVRSKYLRSDSRYLPGGDLYF